MSKEIITPEDMKIYSDLINKGAPCPHCGKGKITHFVLEPNYGIVERTKPCEFCDCERDARINHVKQYADIPAAYYNDDLSKFDWTAYLDENGNVVDLSKIKEFIELYIKNFDSDECKGEGIFFCSKICGSGKTYLASCIANELIKRYAITAKFVSASELIALDKQNDGSIGGLCTTKLLVVDDLGVNQSAKLWNDNVLFRIFDHRMNYKLSTLITSNSRIDKLKIDGRIAGRIYDRHFEILLPEFDVRSKKAKERHIKLFKSMKEKELNKH